MPNFTNDIAKSISTLSRLQQHSKGFLQTKGISSGSKYVPNHILAIKDDLGDLSTFNRNKVYAHTSFDDSDNKKKLNEEKVFNLLKMKELIKDDEEFYKNLFIAILKANDAKESGSKVLKRAIEDQNFIFANQMIAEGVLIDKDCENAFAAAMHTGSEVVERYYSYVGSDGFRSNDFGIGDFRHHKVKKYGLSLGVRFVASDGTSSGYGYTGPALDEITKRIGLHSKMDLKFQEIYLANVRSLSVCNYYGSRVRAEGASRAISDMVKNACERGVVCIPCGFSQHMIGVYVVDGYLVVSDRQTRPGHTPGTKIYKITNPSAYSPEVIETLITGMGKAKSKEEVMGSLLCGVDPAPVYSIHQKAQKMANCTIANPKSAIEGVLFVQELRGASGAHIDRVRKEAHLRYKEFTKDLRRTTVQDLIGDILDNPADDDLRGLAVAYINQQYSRDQHALFLQLYGALGDEQREEVTSSIRDKLRCTVRDRSVSGISTRMQSLMGIFSKEQELLSRPLDRSPEYLPSSLNGKKKSNKGLFEKEHLRSDSQNIPRAIWGSEREALYLLKSSTPEIVKDHIKRIGGDKRSCFSNLSSEETVTLSIRPIPAKA